MLLIGMYDSPFVRRVANLGVKQQLSSPRSLCGRTPTSNASSARSGASCSSTRRPGRAPFWSMLRAYVSYYNDDQTTSALGGEAPVLGESRRVKRGCCAAPRLNGLRRGERPRARSERALLTAG